MAMSVGPSPCLGDGAILLVGDDMMLYRWHRLAHTAPFLFNSHHEPRYISSVRVAYRNSFLYFLFMPSIWISAVLINLGFSAVFVIYLLVKALVIFWRALRASLRCVPLPSSIFVTVCLGG